MRSFPAFGKYISRYSAEDLELEHLTAPSTVTVEPSYRGPHIHLPIHKSHFEALLIAFQRGEVRLRFVFVVSELSRVLITIGFSPVLTGTPRSLRSPHSARAAYDSQTSAEREHRLHASDNVRYRRR